MSDTGVSVCVLPVDYRLISLDDLSIIDVPVGMNKCAAHSILLQLRLILTNQN